MYEFIKIHQVVHLVSLHFTACNYKYPPLLENLLYAASILRKTYISMFLLKEIYRGFLFLWGKQRQKAFNIRFAVSYCRSSTHSSSKNGPATQLPWELYSASQHQAVIALKCVCEHLFFISFCASVMKMCPKVIPSPHYTILAYEGFCWNGLFLDIRENLL